MSLNPTCVLGLVLCLGHVIPTQEGVLPRPSIWAEPGSEIPRGQPMAIVCQGPAGAETLHLEKEGSALLRSVSDPVHQCTRLRPDSPSPWQAKTLSDSPALSLPLL
ncbi:Leukocyte-associated immunoglobulin-like receptor 1 [Vulpes lagopus]